MVNDLFYPTDHNVNSTFDSKVIGVVQGSRIKEIMIMD